MGQLRRCWLTLAACVALVGPFVGPKEVYAAGPNALGEASAGGDAIDAQATISSGDYSGSQHAGCVWTEILPGTAGFEYATAKLEAGISYQLYTRDCAGTVVAIWIPKVTPADLLADLKNRLAHQDLPHPDPIFHELDHKFGWAYVHVPVDFRANPTTWHDYTATAAVDGPTIVWATARATPTRLALHPDDNNPDLASCDAGGALAGYEPKFPGTCSYTYLHASSTASDGYYFHPTFTIEWTVDWRSSLDATWRPLTTLQTSTTTQLAVAEIQAILCTTPERCGQ